MKIIRIVAVFATLLFTGSSHAQGKKPNVLILLADDLGYTDLGCYGSEIQTPNLDRLANQGLRFSQFYNTARCWPSCASIMSGYYPQQVRMDPQQKSPPPWMKLLSHHLGALGYRAYHSGKWHIGVLPRVVADGGFHRSYNLTDQNRFFSPKSHTEDDKPLPGIDPKSGYYATTHIAEHAIRCLKEHAEKHQEQPFFSYVCFTSPHFPLQALPEDIARYKDRYLEGWDKLRQDRYERAKKIGLVSCPLPPWENPTPSLVYKKGDLKKFGAGEVENSPEWKDLNGTQKKYQATKMAIHAAMVDRMDREIGKILDQLKAMNALDDTVIFFLSDNGASAEVMVRGDGHDPNADPGSWATHLCLGGGWASACNSPFRRFKIWVNEGGVSTPMIVHWPHGIPRKGEVCHDVGHVVDFAPTLFELTGTKAMDVAGTKVPPMPGKSLLGSLTKDEGASREIFFKHQGHRALRSGSWKLVFPAEGSSWELYDLSVDRCESKNLANEQSERVQQMSARWEDLDRQWNADAKK